MSQNAKAGKPRCEDSWGGGLPGLLREGLYETGDWGGPGARE